MFERTTKLSHLDTVRYEIDMLEFCFEWLSKKGPKSVPESNLLIEGYLLHYRNLIRFFSGKNHRPGNGNRTADLSTAVPQVWGARDLSDAEKAEMQTPAIALDDKYWDDISQYLQHCTERRFRDPKGWDLAQMHTELKPVVDTFETAWKRERPVVSSITTECASTATFTKSNVLSD